MVVVGAWQHFLGGDGVEDMRNVVQLPSGAYTDSPPLILPLLTQSSATPPSPTVALPATVSWPVSRKPTPEKKRKRGKSQRPGLAIAQ